MFCNTALIGKHAANALLWIEMPSIIRVRLVFAETKDWMFGDIMLSLLIWLRRELVDPKRTRSTSSCLAILRVKDLYALSCGVRAGLESPRRPDLKAKAVARCRSAFHVGLIRPCFPRS